MVFFAVVGVFYGHADKLALFSQLYQRVLVHVHRFGYLIVCEVDEKGVRIREVFYLHYSSFRAMGRQRYRAEPGIWLAFPAILCWLSQRQLAQVVLQAFRHQRHRSRCHPGGDEPADNGNHFRRAARERCPCEANSYPSGDLLD